MNKEQALKNTGGPAFPCDRISMHDHVICSDGMNLRDYFAAKALQGLAAHQIGATRKRAETGAQANARLAYEYADAMLKAREL